MTLAEIDNVFDGGVGNTVNSFGSIKADVRSEDNGGMIDDLKIHLVNGIGFVLVS